MESTCNDEESTCNDEESSQCDSSPKKQDNSFIITSSNWEIDNNKHLNDCVSTVSLLEAPDRTDLEDVVSLDTCVALKSDPSGEACRLEFNVTNKQKIARIAVVSEALVLEFFKQSGEYASTIFAESVDEFQDHAVYFAEVKIEPPSTEASIKFTRRKNKGTTMWIYGIKLILTESSPESSKYWSDFDVFNNYLINNIKLRTDRSDVARFLESFTASENSCATVNSHKFHRDKSNEVNQLNSAHQSTECNGDTASEEYLHLKTYIDNKFATLEKRLMERIELVDQKTNQKLDAILKQLELNVNNQ